MHRHETGHVLETLVAFVNTAPECAGDERLRSPEDVRAFIRTWLITEVQDPAEGEIGALHRLRSQFIDALRTADEGDRRAAVNELLRGATVAPRLADHDGLGPHVHYFPTDASLADHLRADCAMGMALLLSAGEGQRLKSCEAPTCRRVFLDSSKNRSRVYCDGRSCGSRVHAAAYRRRRREAASDG